MAKLKRLSEQAVPAALERATHYRLLNEPMQSESICRDVLRIDPANQEALVTLLLAQTDQFDSRLAQAFAAAQKTLERLPDSYQRDYYGGLICERRANAQLERGGPGSGPIAYDWLRRAMDHYESADEVGPEGNEEALLRWNTCARVIMRDRNIRPLPDERVPTMLE